MGVVAMNLNKAIALCAIARKYARISCENANNAMCNFLVLSNLNRVFMP